MYIEVSEQGLGRKEGLNDGLFIMEQYTTHVPLIFFLFCGAILLIKKMHIFSITKVDPQVHSATE